MPMLAAMNSRAHQLLINAARVENSVKLKPLTLQGLSHVTMRSTTACQQSADAAPGDRQSATSRLVK